MPPKPPKPDSSRRYLEVEVSGRTCYVVEEDLHVFYSLKTATERVSKRYSEIPEEAFIIRVDWTKKLKKEQNRQGIISGLARKQDAVPRQP